MKNEKITLDTSTLPASLRPYAEGAQVWDRSCSNRARTLLLERDGGYFLKIGPADSLTHEARMAAYFGALGFGPEVLDFFCEGGQDYMLTRRIPGEVACSARHLSDPARMAGVLGESLRALHDAPCTNCPVHGVTAAMIPRARARYTAGTYDAWMLEYAGIQNAEEGAAYLAQAQALLVEDVHLHGDACLPNVLLDDFRFTGFIDFEGGGVGDRHFDLLWTIWSLHFNTKSHAFRDRFLDAYGQDAFDPERLRAVCALQAFTWED